MGGKNAKPKGGDRGSSGNANRKVCMDDFQPVKTIGEGGYSTVVLMKKKSSGKPYAMKILNKEALIEREEVEHSMVERQVLELADHPFLIKMYHAFQTTGKLCLVMQYANGGELFTHLKQRKRLEEHIARFYAAEILLALEYLHLHKLVYRDLKPENVLLDSEGHVKMTDFGLAKFLAENEQAKTMCGTPEYFAPEVLQGRGHGQAVDWWTFGALLYEMLTGTPPFYSQDTREMYDAILHADLYIPEFVNLDAANLLSRLLTKNPAKRLGAKPHSGPSAIKEHPFFKTVDWRAVYYREPKPPIVPKVSGPDDISYVDPKLLNTDPTKSTESPKSAPPLLDSNEQREFDGFSYAGTGTTTASFARTASRTGLDALSPSHSPLQNPSPHSGGAKGHPATSLSTPQSHSGPHSGRHLDIVIPPLDGSPSDLNLSPDSGEGGRSLRMAVT